MQQNWVKNPLVSIITPSYNQGQFLEATMLSVLEQDYPHIEYILMDGGSSDNSLEVIRRYAPRLASWESQPDRGQAHAINKGLQRARGELLGWLNSDDLLLPGVVSRAVQVFREHPQVDVVYGRLERIDERGELLPTPALPKDRVDFSLKHVLGECVVNQPGSFWRRRVMEQVGWLDERLRFTMDYEYWTRMALAGARFMHLSMPVAQFRLSIRSKTVGQTAEFAQEQLQTLDALVARPDLPARTGLTLAQAQRQAQRTRAGICLNVCYGYVKLGKRRLAAKWLVAALQADALVLFQRRWFDLAIARLRNQNRRRPRNAG